MNENPEVAKSQIEDFLEAIEVSEVEALASLRHSRMKSIGRSGITKRCSRKTPKTRRKMVRASRKRNRK